jgi:hypothetical protein
MANRIAEKWKPVMSRILRDPLLHFVLLGMLLFAIFYLINPPDEAATENQIRITQGDIDQFRQIYKNSGSMPLQRNSWTV